MENDVTIKFTAEQINHLKLVMQKDIEDKVKSIRFTSSTTQTSVIEQKITQYNKSKSLADLFDTISRSDNPTTENDPFGS